MGQEFKRVCSVALFACFLAISNYCQRFENTAAYLCNSSYFILYLHAVFDILLWGWVLSGLEAVLGLLVGARGAALGSLFGFLLGLGGAWVPRGVRVLRPTLGTH